MFDQIMKWFRNLLSDHDQETKLPESRNLHTQNQTVEARMSYQYPKKSNFRFPVIPDQEPAPVRRERHRNRQQTAQLENRERYQQKEPFKPTDVPSPVYGFHKNLPDQEAEIEVIPSFIRNRENRKPDHLIEPEEHPAASEVVKEEKNELVTNVINAEETFQNRRKNKQENEDVQPNHSAETGSTVENHPKPTVNQTSQAEKENRTREESSNDINRPKEETNRQQRQSAIHSHPKPTHTPFNVIMTPGDRKKMIHNGGNSQNPDQGTLPPFHLLDDTPESGEDNHGWVKEQTERLETTLKHFHVKAKVTNVMKGPTVTRFEVQPEPGVKVSKITNLSDDIKLNLAAKDIRMEAPIPGKNAIGIEVPNLKAEPVYLSEILKDKSFQNSSSPLTVALGLDIAGEPVVTDLKKMPHGLIAGATGSGKSVCINTILISLLFKASHHDVRFMLIDPKMVELAPYNGIPHLVSPVITDVKAATSALKWAVGEMEERYERFVETGVRDIEKYNDKMQREGKNNQKMPYLVIIIDELADLMMVSPQDVEDAICRIAQKARACGIHLLLATQRPSVDVITGLIKANIPTRVAFSVSSQVDSRTIIDTNGAEKLLGKGDMLFLENGAGKSRRIQGAFVSDEEIERVTHYVKKQGHVQYLFKQDDLIEQFSVEENEDDLLYEVIDFVVEGGSASTSLLQRRFKIGYNRAARLIDRMEELGIISEQKGSKPRDVLMSKEQVHQLVKADHH